MYNTPVGKMFVYITYEDLRRKKIVKITRSLF